MLEVRWRLISRWAQGHNVKSGLAGWAGSVCSKREKNLGDILRRVRRTNRKMMADMDEPGAADKTSLALAYHSIHGIDAFPPEN